MKYRLTYVEKLPRPPIAWLATQRRIHAALAAYHHLAKTDGVVRIDELLLRYDALMGADNNPDVRDGKEYQEGEEILRLYADREAQRRRVAAYLEQKLRVEFGPYILSGRVDRVDFVGAGYEIVDYKLDRKLPPANPAAVSEQLDFYQLLVYEKLGHYSASVSLDYLRHGKIFTAPRTADDMARTADRIDRTAKKIIAERKWAPCEGDGCKTCSFVKLCPAKTGVERRDAKAVWEQAEMFF